TLGQLKLSELRVMMNKFYSNLKKYILILLCSVGLLSTQNSYASHYAAVDMYIDYIGTGPSDLTYRIVLQVYKACERYPNGGMNVGLSPNETVHILSPSGCATYLNANGQSFESIHYTG